MNPSALSGVTGSMKRTRSEDGLHKAESGSSPVKSDSNSADMRTQLPSFLALTKNQVSSRFQELEWQQRFRMAHALQNVDSPWKIERSTIITARNRYMNIQPWANSRIVLKVPAGQSDYVNASPIILRDTKSGIENRYIATQGPKDTSHFWHMVLQETQEPAVVVMLTQTREGTREKCAQYYPLSMASPTISLPTPEKAEGEQEAEEPRDPFYEPQPPLPSGSITLLEVSTDPVSRSEVRKLNLTIGNESRTVYHYLFTGWPDFAKPEGEDRQGLLELIKQTSIQAGNPTTNPRIVHCSAGVGRTGTFIALDYLIKEIDSGAIAPTSTPVSPKSSSSFFQPITKSKANGNSTNTNEQGKDEMSGAMEDPIYQTVNLLREQRMMMVMNEIQFSFIYEFLRERFEAKYLNKDKELKLRITTASGAQDEVKSRTIEPEDVATTTESRLDSDDALKVEERSPKIARKNSQVSALSTAETDISKADLYTGTNVEKGVQDDADTVSD